MTNLNNVLLFLKTYQLYAALVALPVLAGLNILQGWALANFAKTYDKAKMVLGIQKGLVVYFTIAVLSFIAEFLIISEIDIKTTIALIIYAVTLSYLLQNIDKLKLIINYKAPVNETE